MNSPNYEKSKFGFEVRKVHLHCTAWKWGIVEQRSAERETKK